MGNSWRRVVISVGKLCGAVVEFVCCSCSDMTCKDMKYWMSGGVLGCSLTSVRHTRVNFFFRAFTLFRAFLVWNTGTLIMGVLMLELAIIRISLNLCGGDRDSEQRVEAEHYL